MNQRREPGFGPDPRQPRLELDASQDLRPRTQPQPRRRGPALPLFAILVMLLGGVAYALLGHVGQTHVTESGIPVILADPTPVRVRPEQPGGMEIPFQDTTVYDELAQGRKHASGSTEHLLASPEQPLPKPEAPAAKPDPVTDAPQPPAVPAPSVTFPPVDNDAVLAPQLPPPAKAPAPTPKLLLPPPPAHALAKPAPATDDAADDTDDQPAPVKSKPAAAMKAVSGGHSEMQLGAYRDAAVAETEWQKLLAAHGDELGTLSHHVERADLGDKGIWYRLKAGPLDDAHARQDCTILKGDGVTCFVPGK